LAFTQFVVVESEDRGGIGR